MGLARGAWEECNAALISVIHCRGVGSTRKTMMCPPLGRNCHPSGHTSAVSSTCSSAVIN